jgi:hypothetical protein
MLYSQRKAFEAMSAPRRMLHRILWGLYWPVAGVSVLRRAWGLYRRTWPT